MTVSDPIAKCFKHANYVITYGEIYDFLDEILLDMIKNFIENLPTKTEKQIKLLNKIKTYVSQFIPLELKYKHINEYIKDKLKMKSEISLYTYSDDVEDRNFDYVLYHILSNMSKIPSSIGEMSLLIEQHQLLNDFKPYITDYEFIYDDYKDDEYENDIITMSKQSEKESFMTEMNNILINKINKMKNRTSFDTLFEYLKSYHESILKVFDISHIVNFFDAQNTNFDDIDIDVYFFEYFNNEIQLTSENSTFHYREFLELKSYEKNVYQCVTNKNDCEMYMKKMMEKKLNNIEISGCKYIKKLIDTQNHDLKDVMALFVQHIDISTQIEKNRIKNFINIATDYLSKYKPINFVDHVINDFWYHPNNILLFSKNKNVPQIVKFVELCNNRYVQLNQKPNCPIFDSINEQKLKYNLDQIQQPDKNKFNQQIFEIKKSVTRLSPSEINDYMVYIINKQDFLSTSDEFNYLALEHIIEEHNYHDYISQTMYNKIDPVIKFSDIRMKYYENILFLKSQNTDILNEYTEEQIAECELQAKKIMTDSVHLFLNFNDLLDCSTFIKKTLPTIKERVYNSPINKMKKYLYTNYNNLTIIQKYTVMTISISTLLSFITNDYSLFENTVYIACINVILKSSLKQMIEFENATLSSFVKSILYTVMHNKSSQNFASSTNVFGYLWWFLIAYYLYMSFVSVLFIAIDVLFNGFISNLSVKLRMELINVSTNLIKVYDKMNRETNFEIKYGNILVYSNVKHNIDEETLEKIAPLKCKGTNPNIEIKIVDCAICRDEFSTQGLHRELPCKHIFHAHCIDNWLSNSATCPFCRNQLIEPKVVQQDLSDNNNL
jgi:hypothetical protein